MSVMLHLRVLCPMYGSKDAFENNVENPTGLISTGGKLVLAIDCNRGSTKTDGYNNVLHLLYI